MNLFLQRINNQLDTKNDTVFRVLLYSLENYPYIPDEMTAEVLHRSRGSEAKRSAVLNYMPKVTLGDQSIQQLLSCLAHSEKYTRFIDQVELEKLFEYREQFAPYVAAEDWEFYEQVKNTENEEEMFMLYAGLLQELSVQFTSNKYNQAKRVMDQLVDYGWVTGPEVIGAIEESAASPYMNYNGLLNIYALRYFKEDRYISTLVDLLRSEEDLVLEEAAASLNYFQTDHLADQIYPFCFNEDFIYPISLLGEIKTDYALFLLKKLFGEIEDLEARELVVEGICLHFAEQGFEEVETFMEQGEFSGLVDMDELAYAYFKVINRDHPDLMLWKNEVEEREAFFQQELSPGPFVREVKVGRNDPCPCGSGKKYKKCCGA
ncbi:SEC-C metal-binding domain-containing protein [Halobacillus andaensis]|uniref:SEC-C metal-binding domain-containing protein n=1 Tax=Halobacillus andaensis TaxID=1176239 RepID=UPI003D73FF59